MYKEGTEYSIEKVREELGDYIPKDKFIMALADKRTSILKIEADNPDNSCYIENISKISMNGRATRFHSMGSYIEIFTNTIVNVREMSDTEYSISLSGDGIITFIFEDSLIY